MALSRIKVWGSELLTSSDLNAEINNVLNNPISLISPLTGSLDIDGQSLTLDAAAVTTVVSSAAVSWNFTSGAKSGTPATTGAIVNYSAQTFTDNVTAGSGTATAYVAYAIQRPTLAATNASVTTTNAATFYIPNAPAAGTNETLTNSYALWIDDGRVRLDPSASVVSAASATLDAVNITAQTATISGSTNITTATGVNFVSVGIPTLSAASALTVTNAATVYIAGAPAGGGAGPATITNAYSIWCDAGTARFDGIIDARGGQIAFPATQSASADANTLDDYEETDFSASVSDGSGAGLAFSAVTGYSTKIGDRVSFSLTVTYPSTVNGANTQINGLPYSVVGDVALSVTSNAGAAFQALAGSVAAGAISIYAAGSFTRTINSALSTFKIYVSGNYRV